MRGGTARWPRAGQARGGAAGAPAQGQFPHHQGRRAGVGKEDEIMFRLFRVSVSIFLGLTDRPINLIYRVSPHPLTSSTGLLSNNELLRLGTIGVLVPIAFVLQLLR